MHGKSIPREKRWWFILIQKHSELGLSDAFRFLNYEAYPGNGYSGQETEIHDGWTLLSRANWLHYAVVS